MKRLLLPLTTIVATVALLWTSATPAHACVCSTLPLPERIDDADVIATGTVGKAHITHVYRPDARPPNTIEAYVDVRVDRYFKGGGGKTLKVDVDDISSCAFVPDPGRWLLFLHEHGSYFRTNEYFEYRLHELFTEVCSGSERFDVGSNGEADRAKVVSVTGPGSAAASFPLLPAAVAATVGPLVFLAAAAFVWRRKGGTA